MAKLSKMNCIAMTQPLKCVNAYQVWISRGVKAIIVRNCVGRLLGRFELTSGKTKGSLNPKTDATVSTGSKHEKIAPNKIILPIRGLTGKAAK